MTTPIRFNTGVNGFCVARSPTNYIVLLPDNRIQTPTGFVHSPNGQRVIWPDLSANGKITGTSQTVNNIAWEWDGVLWKSSKCYSVPRCCIYKPDNSLVTVQTPGETGSMGYIQVSDSGQLVKTDSQYSGPPLWEYIIRGNVTVGHGNKGSAGENPLLCKIDNVVRLLEKGNCLAIKFYRDGDNCAIAWINNAISNVWFPTVAELKTFPIYNPQTNPVPPEPPVMGLPTKVNDLWKQWNVKFKIPLGEDNIRQWMIRFCEQTAFTFPNEGWGTKSASETRPISKDTITQVTPFSAANAPKPNSVKTGMKSWDMVSGAGSPTPRPLFSGQTEHDTKDQWFRKVVPTNHLGTATEPPIPSPGNKDREFILHLQEEIDSYLDNN